MTREEIEQVVAEARAAGRAPDLVDIPTPRDLHGIDLHNALMFRAFLWNSNLAGANLRCANLCKADLCYADLRGADLTGAELRDADLTGANLCGANLCGIKLGDTNLSGTGVVVIRAGNHCIIVTPTHIHIDWGRMAREDFWADDDLEAQRAVDADMPDWWRQYGGVVRAAMAVSAAEWAAREAPEI